MIQPVKKAPEPDKLSLMPDHVEAEAWGEH